jgi:hypothetical protein
VSAPPVQLPFMHIAGSPATHAVLGATQVEPTQHEPAVVGQLDFAQHGCVGPPHAVTVPFAHTMPLAPGLSPDA